jgi:hypothetical protein
MPILTPAPRNFQQPIRSLVAEMLGLSKDDLRPMLLHFRNVLDATTTTATDYFRAPGDKAFVAWEVRAHVAPQTVGAETLSTTTTNIMASASWQDRLIQKLMNARATLFNPDLDDMQFLNSTVSSSGVTNKSATSHVLSNLHPLCGGRPIKWVAGPVPVPLIVQPLTRLGCNILLNDTTTVGGTTPATGSTEYGLTLVGAFVATRNS